MQQPIPQCAVRTCTQDPGAALAQNRACCSACHNAYTKCTYRIKICNEKINELRDQLERTANTPENEKKIIALQYNIEQFEADKKTAEEHKKNHNADLALAKEARLLQRAAARQPKPKKNPLETRGRKRKV